jgi:hypothetical protein
MALIDTRDAPQQTIIVAQENIVLQPGDVIEHPEVGYYFTAFRAGNYIPNKALAFHYPFDSFSNVEITPLQPQPPNGVKRTASSLY